MRTSPNAWLWLERVFWFGTPAAMAAVLFWPRPTVVRVGASLSLLPESLPEALALVWYFFPGTLLGLAVMCLSVAACALRSAGRTTAAAVWLPTFFLPTYVAGFEAVGLTAWSIRCHSGATRDFEELIAVAVILTCAVFLLTVLAGTLAARIRGYRSNSRLLTPALVASIVASAELPWLLLWHVAVPRV
jgi:hypothetical protein